MRKLFLAIPIAIFAIGGSTACATKKFVRTSVGEVNDKVDSLGRSLEETQERTRQNEAKISDVDKATQAAAQAAKNADDKAVAANSAASAAANTANGAVAKADEIDKASKKLVPAARRAGSVLIDCGMSIQKAASVHRPITSVGVAIR